MGQPATERTELLDALRGFALLGIVGANYAVISGWLFMPQEAQAALPGSAADGWTRALHTVFVDGKFYSIFSLLFGIGFGLFLQKGADGLPRFLRRTAILLVIGWLHVRFVWEGDILLCYALLGLLLPVFRKAGDRTLLWTAVALLLLPIALDLITVSTHGAFHPGAWFGDKAHEALLRSEIPPEQGLTYIADGGWTEFMAWRKITWLWRFEHLLVSNRLPKVLGLFLIGLWVARRGLFRDVGAHRALFRKVLAWGVFIGLPCSVVMWWSEEHLDHAPAPEGLVYTISYAFSVVPLAMAYASAFALLWAGAQQRILRVFAPVGRMALTNYLMQSIFGLALFTGMGLGLGSRTSPIRFELMALGVYLLQLLYSTWWMKHFRFGPMEWLWRVLTYGRWMPIRKR